MGTSLTGLTPATTYDALIKVGDNGPLSATAKVLSDGLGNDSKLNLSTASVGIGTSSPSTIFGVEDTNANVAVVNVIGTSPNYIFDVRDDGTSVFRVAGSGNVGIGTTNFAFFQYGNFGGSSINLNQAIGNTTDEVGINIGTNQSSINFGSLNSTSSWTNINRIVSTTSSTSNNQESGYLEFFTKSGAVSTPSAVRLRVDQDGIKFNGDTAAANALDDYEEGTWTMGITFGGGSTGNVYAVNTGTYTKIGRQVTVNGVVGLSTKGSSTGIASLSGLPFSVGNSTAPFFASASIWFNNVTFAGQFQSRTEVATTNLQLWQTSILGVISQLNDTNFANNSEISVSLTYFVA
jgi:hypothetical protein